jgi:predicted enzyme related to lactoylglutathione lyase
MDENSLKHGAFSWFELMTTDVDSAKKFYTALFNWGLKDMPMDNMNYTVVSVDGEDVAGLMPMPPGTEEMPPSWSQYITVDDVDVTAAKAKELGGKVLVEPQDIPDIGRFCVIQDPQGAWFSAITYVKE